MNFYKHHLGDYDGATAHLTWLEDMAYTRLIRLYYRTERPVPADLAQTCRLVRAASKQERQAVEAVLREFFTLESDGWHQKRCDEELSTAAELEEERNAKADNEKERQRRHRKMRREMFKALRDLGLVPAWDTKTETLREMFQKASQQAPVTPLVTVTDGDSKRDGHEPVTRTATANQTPDASNQLPGIEPSPLPPLAIAPGAKPPSGRKRSPKTPCPDSFELGDAMYDWANGKGLDDDRVLAETERFLLHHKAKGNQWADWQAAWRTWMLNAVRFDKERKAS